MENPFNRPTILDSRKGRIRHEDINEILLALDQRRVGFMRDRTVESDRLAIRTAEVMDRFRAEFQ